ncbi:adenylosuccinate lyase [Candidatus Azambacteria bacterium RIFCSPLOWO2_01_FULL_46_25]|uniref:Adenylosuccinate lyase n=1 Tax=Candidatus Azambacteria bacterium RIFCSPLOWO2_01_FULL_46_25 TaxID=1797298 RepID=A0A1F5BT75_9BACT|nr:MAG: adenylosuccinate lyase [Candidatus Azambacteria bacterium RIFCSPLOWO2_01_FULL_46_25]
MPLNSISPIDGRYRKYVEALAPYFSEQALMRYRLIVEGEYLIALSETRGIDMRKLSRKEQKLIRGLANLKEKDAERIVEIERTTDHDVKAVEYYMKDKFARTSLKDVSEWIHFALTSEDTNNIAYALILRDSLEKVMIPKVEEIAGSLNKLAKKHKNLAMLARTHGQPASPTTFGKEMKVFAARLERRVNRLRSMKIKAKLNGATGNYNAHVAAYPRINWIQFSKKFIKKLGLEANLITTQIEPHDNYVSIFDNLRRVNTILLGLDQDIWRYISDEWIVQRPKEGTVGSSTMPHKVNPIKFENSEGNLGMANALFEFFARKLPISRLQRDLSDSTVERNFGVAFSHSLIAYEYLLKGLSQITVNEKKIKEELENHPEVIAEAIQTILRREGAKMPYEELKALTRGRKVTMADFEKFIDGLNVPEKVKKELRKITPQNYTGLAAKLV